MFTSSYPEIWPDLIISFRNWPDQESINQTIIETICDKLELTDLTIQYNEILGDEGDTDTWIIKDGTSIECVKSNSPNNGNLIEITVDNILQLTIKPLNPFPSAQYIIGHLLAAFSKREGTISPIDFPFPDNYLQYCIQYRDIGPDISTILQRLDLEKEANLYPALTPIYDKPTSNPNK